MMDMGQQKAWRHEPVTGLAQRALLHVTLTALLLLGGGAYMQAKGYFAQYLIEQAWMQTLEDNDTRVLMPSYHDQLTLITCYPLMPYKLAVRTDS